MKTMYRVVAMGILVASSAHNSFATPLIGSPSGIIANAPIAAGYSIGYRFVVGPNDLSVNALGVWDNGADGLLIAHDVALYDDAGTQLAVATVPAGLAGTSVGQYLYTSIAPVMLTSGLAYRLSTYLGTGEDYMNSGATFSVDSAASSYASFSSKFIGPVVSVSFPTSSAGDGGYVGPNLDFSVVPEPNSLTLICLGSAGVSRIVRRRRS